MRIRRALALVAVVAAGVAPSGCGSVSGREEAATAAAQRFLDAVTDGDGVAACAVLAPKTVEELEKSGSCSEAVLDEDLPEPGPVETADVYGQWARVVMPDDTVFLAVFPDGWRVVAAGCRPAGEGPYDCVLQGG